MKHKSLSALLKELEAAGVTETEIASASGLSQPTINRLKNGEHKKTNYDAGNAIVILHRQRVLATGQAA